MYVSRKALVNKHIVHAHLSLPLLLLQEVIKSHHHVLAQIYFSYFSTENLICLLVTAFVYLMKNFTNSSDADHADKMLSLAWIQTGTFMVFLKYFLGKKT